MPSRPPSGVSSYDNPRLAPDYFDPVPIYIPTKPWIDHPFRILPGSAIVGCPRPDDVPLTMIFYYEGNLYGDAYFSRFARRCLHAHGRMAQKYPTVACGRIGIRHMIPVGIWHPREQTVEVTDPALLAEWCGWTLPLDPEQLTAE